ncbi:hypothetical protein HDU92_000736 [Lobulomyces angularis]|nr:hypothetical protein HDU92_000736 [Lobulomyces angularis]
MSTPHRQGDLDSACGVYAVLNACSYASKKNKKSPSLSATVLHHLCNGDKKVCLKTETLRNLVDPESGTNKIELEEALKKAVTVFNEKLNYGKLKYTFFEPYGSNVKSDRRTIFNLVMEQFNTLLAKAVIIGITGHWTVVVAATQNRWTLLDSDGMKRINKKQWIANEDFEKGIANEAWAIYFEDITL